MVAFWAVLKNMNFSGKLLWLLFGQPVKILCYFYLTSGQIPNATIERTITVCLITNLTGLILLFQYIQHLTTYFLAWSNPVQLNFLRPAIQQYIGARQYWSKTTFGLDNIGTRQYWSQTILEPDNIGARQYWSQTTLGLDNIGTRQYWDQTILGQTILEPDNIGARQHWG